MAIFDLEWAKIRPLERGRKSPVSEVSLFVITAFQFFLIWTCTRFLSCIVKAFTQTPINANAEHCSGLDSSNFWLGSSSTSNFSVASRECSGETALLNMQ